MSDMNDHQESPRERAENLARDTADEIRSAVDKKADETRREVHSVADGLKEEAAENIQTIADSLNAASDRLSGDQDRLASWVGSLASELETASRSLQSRPLSSLVEDVEQFGRRRPDVLIGGAVAVGFALARFGKSSSRRKAANGPAETRPHTSPVGNAGDGGPAHAPQNKPGVYTYQTPGPASPSVYPRGDRS